MARGIKLQGGKRPQLRKVRKGGFAAAKQERFFKALAETCNISASCRRARVSRDTIDRYRKSDGAFRARFADVKRGAYERLELATVERALNGSVKTVTKPDGSVQTMHEYPLAIAIQLLRMHRESVAKTEAAEALEETDADELRARLADKLERLRKRMEQEEKEEKEERGKGGGGPA
jgi:hypothetical protein